MTAQPPAQTGLVVRNSAFNLLGQILPLLVGLATIPYVVRGLGPTGYGILSIAWTVLGYFSIFDLGLSRATTKFVAQHLVAEQSHRLPALIWTAVALQILLGIAGALIALPLVPVVVDHLFTIPAQWEHEAKTSLFILCGSLPILLVNNALRGVIEAAQRFDLSNYVKVPASILFSLLAALSVFLHVRVSGIITLLVLSRCAAALAYLVLCCHLFPGLMAHITISRDSIRPLAAYGGWVTISNTAAPIFGYVERFTIASVLSVGMLTYYSAPFDLVGKVIIFPASITAALFPYFSYHGARHAATVSDVTSRTIKYLMFVMIPVIAIFVVFARQILHLWLGVEFADRSTVVMQVLAVSCFLNALSYVPFTSVQALGRPDLKAILDAAALPAYALYSWWLIKHLGINGAAFAKLISSIIDCAFLFGFAWKLKALSVRDYLSGPLVRTFVAGCVMTFALSVMRSFHPSIPLTIVFIAASFACYAVAFWTLAVDSSDRFTIRALSRQMLARRQAIPLQ